LALQAAAMTVGKPSSLSDHRKGLGTGIVPHPAQ
jgi:hypothetical protein